MASHDRTPSQSTDIGGSNNSNPASSPSAQKRRSFLSSGGRPSVFANIRKYSFNNAARPAPSHPENMEKKLEEVDYKVPFFGVVSTVGQMVRDKYLNNLFDPSIRPLVGKERPYTDFTMHNRKWNCWVDLVVHPLSQPTHFLGQLEQLDALLIIYSSRGSHGFTSAAEILNSYFNNSEDRTAANNTRGRSGADLPFPVLVSVDIPVTTGNTNERPITEAEGEALARKYNGRFVHIPNMTTEENIIKPLEITVAGWVMNHTGMAIHPNEERAKSASSNSQLSATSGTSPVSPVTGRPYGNKRRQSSMGQSHISRASLQSGEVSLTGEGFGEDTEGRRSNPVARAFQKLKGGLIRRKSSRNQAEDEA